MTDQSEATQWEAVDPGDLKAGDKVRLTHDNGSLIYGDVGGVYPDGGLSVTFDGGIARHFYQRQGWTLERAVPDVFDGGSKHE